MAKPPPLAAAPGAESPLDRALGAIASKDAERALRWAAPLARADLVAPVPALALGLALGELGQEAPARLALEVAADAGADGGNLPIALAALSELARRGADTSARALAVARGYARGSSRLRGAAPPPAGAPPSVEPLGNGLAGAALVAAATEVVEYGRAAVDSAREGRAEPPPVAAQAFFSSLSVDALRALATAFHVRVVGKGEKVVTQGEPGAEAFVLARGELEVVRDSAGAAPILLARLGKGAVFGEMALLSRAPRAASVVAARPSVVLVIGVDALERVAEASPEVGAAFASFCHRRMVANLVRTSPLLGPLSAGERTALIERFATRSFDAGHRLIVQGEQADGLHVIASGEVTVQRDDGGDRVVIARLGVGEVVGEVSLVFRRTSNADVVAAGPTITLFLPRARFMDIVREHPTLLAQLYDLAARRDDETSSIVAEVAEDAEDLLI